MQLSDSRPHQSSARNPRANERGVPLFPPIRSIWSVWSVGRRMPRTLSPDRTNSSGELGNDRCAAIGRKEGKKELRAKVPPSQLTVSLAIFAPADAGWTDDFIAVTDICSLLRTLLSSSCPADIHGCLSQGFMYVNVCTFFFGYFPA